MRVAVVVSTFPPYQGGMGNAAAAHVEALRRAGHDVTVFAPGAGLRPLLRIGNAAVVPQLFWKLRGYEAVELHYPFFGGAEWVWLWKAVFGRTSRLVIMYHMDTVGRGLAGLVFRAYRSLMLRRVLGAADAVMASSRDYLESSQIGFMRNDRRAVEVPFGVDAVRFHPGTGAKGGAILFVGALDSAHYFKGVDVLIEAFASIADAEPEAELVIVGEGNLRAVLEEKASSLGLGERVRFLGRVPDDRLADIYRDAAMHVLPSIDRSEAFGLVTLAAAASGIPSIVSELPGMRSLVEPGVSGLLVKPSDIGSLAAALRALLADGERARKMGAAARERVTRLYSSEKVDGLVVKTVCGIG